jgi:hypothetical protein
MLGAEALSISVVAWKEAINPFFLVREGNQNFPWSLLK